MRAVLTVVALMLSLAAPAEARPVHFAGPHPIAARFGGGYCYIETPHLHVYAPDHGALFQQVGDDYVFTGDPTPFGYEGEKHTFYGHHPIVSASGEPVYCYLNGPHSHSFPPVEGPDYKIKGDVAFYTGPFAPSYARQKPHREKLVNAEYRPYAGFRPTVEVNPPPEWHGDVYAPAPVVVVGAPGVAVHAPGLVVAPPEPRILITPPEPRVILPQAPRVVVGAPGVFVGGEVHVHERHEHWRGGDDDDHHHGHHDNGKHKGWYK